MGLLFETPRARAARVARRLGRAVPSPLAGRVVVVTGASSGIGAATARAVAGRGAAVVLVARSEDGLRAVQEEIAAAGGTSYVEACDLTDFDAVDRLVKRLLAEHGTIDYLVNNAGRSIRRSLALSYDRFHDVERTMAVNFVGPVRLTLGLLPAMRAQRFGHVVNILSWGVQIPAPKFSAYLASKSALDTWSRIAGRETYDDNVTFTNVRLGPVRTKMLIPTAAREDRAAITETEAAERVVRALEDRPVTVNERAGTPAELLQLVFPRLSDAVLARYDRQVPDTPEARGER